MFLKTALLIAGNLFMPALCVLVDPSAPIPSSKSSGTALSSPIPCHDIKSPESKLITDYRTLEDLFRALDTVNGHDEDNDWLTTSDSCFVPAETALKAIPAPALAELSENLNQSDDVIERRGRVHYALEALKRLDTFFKKVDGSSSGGKGSSGRGSSGKGRGGKKTKPQREPYKKPETPDEWRNLVRKNSISPKEAKRADDWEEAKYDEIRMTGKSPSDPKFYGKYKCAARVGRIARKWGPEITNAVIAAGTIAVLDIGGKPVPRRLAKNNKIIGHKPRSKMVKDLYEGFGLLKKTKSRLGSGGFVTEIEIFLQDCPKGKNSFKLPEHS
jgi:hypothetical protein